MNAPDEHTLPVEETVTDKMDVVNWSLVKDEACELEFRDRFDLAPSQAVEVVMPPLVQLSLASVAAWAIAYPTSIWVAPFVDHTALAVLSVAVGIAWAAWATLAGGDRGEDMLTSFLRPAVLARAALPLLLWQAIAYTSRLHLLSGAFSYRMLVSLPVAVLLFDHFATYAVYWNTASPTADHVAKSLGRVVWQCRLLGPAVPCGSADPHGQNDADTGVIAIVDSTRAYVWGPVWLAAATLLPTLLLILILGEARPTLVGLGVLSINTLGLFVAVVLRSAGDARVVSRFFRMVFLWFRYGWGEQLPPWLFRSPCGGPLRRQVIIMLAAGLLAVPLISLAAHSFTALGEAVSSAPSAGSSPSWLWIAPTVMVALLLGPLDFCLIGILLTGHLLVAYHDTFERPLPPPERPVFPDDDAQLPEDGTAPESDPPESPAPASSAETVAN